MSGLLSWPPFTVRADMPAHPVAVGQREGPYPDDVAASMRTGLHPIGCPSTPTQRHTLVNAHASDHAIAAELEDGTPIIISTKVCQRCSRWVHFTNVKGAA